MESQNQTKQKRLLQGLAEGDPVIEGLRGFAALLVMVTHYVPMVRPELGAWGFASTGVDLFFVLSGYVFAPYLFGKPLRLAPHLIRRFFRLYPLYLVALLLYVALRLPAASAWDHFAVHLFMAHTFSSLDVAYFYNAAFWSLPPEVEYYLLLPLLAWAATRNPTASLRLPRRLAPRNDGPRGNPPPPSLRAQRGNPGLDGLPRHCAPCDEPASPTVIASEARQSTLTALALQHGSPRRCAPRDDDTGSWSVCGSGPELEARNDRSAASAMTKPAHWLFPASVLVLAAAMHLLLVVAATPAEGVTARAVATIHLPGLLIEFMWGSLAYAMVQRAATLGARLLRLALGLLVLAGMGWVFVCYVAPVNGVAGTPPPWIGGNIGFGAALGYALLVSALASAPRQTPPDQTSRWFTPWFVLMGQLSYGVYLFHNAAPQILRRVLPTASGVVAVLLCVAITLALAWAAHHAIERPLRNYGRKLSVKKRHAIAALRSQ